MSDTKTNVRLGNGLSSWSLVELPCLKTALVIQVLLHFNDCSCIEGSIIREEVAFVQSQRLKFDDSIDWKEDIYSQVAFHSLIVKLYGRGLSRQGYEHLKTLECWQPL